jgi:hypothetical protein
MPIRRTFVVAMVFAALAVLAVPRPAEGSWSVSISLFHEQLSPYGQWVVAGSYGDCWVPARVAAGWSPYFDGEWIWTDYGWTWVSYDPWGDIPYHYGAWVWVDPYGWVWVPGTIWAPAWVTWAYSDDYIGWAPVPPSFVLTASGYSGRPIVVAERYYCFVPTRQFVGVSVSTVRVPVQQNPTLFTQATKTTGYTVSGGIVRTAGPPASRIEKIAGKHIERVSIDRAKTRPTSLSAVGMAKAHSLRVVAPASERARAIHAVAKGQGGKPGEAQAEQHQRAAVRPKAVKPKAVKPEKSAAATAPKHEKAGANPPKHERVASAPRHEQPQTRVVKKKEPKPEQAPPAVKSAEQPKHEKAPASGHQPKHVQPQPAAAPAGAPAQPPPGQVKKEQPAAAKAPPAPQHGQGQEKKKEKEKD